MNEEKVTENLKHISNERTEGVKDEREREKGKVREKRYV